MCPKVTHTAVQVPNDQKARTQHTIPNTVVQNHAAIGIHRNGSHLQGHVARAHTPSGLCVARLTVDHQLRPNLAVLHLEGDHHVVPLVVEEVFCTNLAEIVVDLLHTAGQ